MTASQNEKTSSLADIKDVDGQGTIHAAAYPVMGPHGDSARLNALENKTTLRTLKPRHVQLIAISGAIGTGLFIGSGSALKRAGPIGLLLGYAVYGLLVLGSFNAMGEMVSYLPVDGSYLQFSRRFVDPSYGFAMGWFATYNNAVTIAAEATAVAGLINYWNDTVSNGVWCTLFVITAFCMNFFGVKYFGEGEFWFSIMKVLLIIGLFFFTFITMVGGNPTHDVYGFRHWKNPGPFVEYIAEGSLGQFLGFWSVLIQAAYAYGGPDFLAMTAGEAKYPRRVLPGVFKRVIYRLLIFYVGGVLAIGILLSGEIASDDPDLGTAKKGAGSSPFVLAAVRMGIPALPGLINALILTSAWSAGMSQTFTSSRNLFSCALNGHAPAFFRRTWRGVPVFCVIAVVLVGCLSFMSLGAGAATAFSWITNILGGLWILNLLLQHIIYVRFRAGIKAQGIDRSKFPFYRRGQLYVSWFSIFAYAVVFLTNGFAVFTKGGWSVADFFFAYMTLPLFIVAYAGHKLWDVLINKAAFRILRPEEMDFVSGREEIEDDEMQYPPVGTAKIDRLNHWLWG